MTATPISKSEDFARQAQQAPPTLIGELAEFLLHNKVWWITPVVAVLLLVSAFIILTGTGLAPLLYTIF
jgi:Family of unknown function (DUF5989)